MPEKPGNKNNLKSSTFGLVEKISRNLKTTKSKLQTDFLI